MCKTKVLLFYFLHFVFPTPVEADWEVFAQNGDIDYFKHKISDGWDIDERGTGKETALIWATMYAKDDLVRWLVQNGADVNAVEETDGYTALHYAHTASVAEFLLSHGADITSQNNLNEWNPLHRAANWKDKDVVSLLLRKGANPAVKDNEGRTAFDLATNSDRYISEAERSQYKDIIHIFKEHEQWTRAAQALAVVIGCNWDTLESILTSTKDNQASLNDETIPNLKNEVDKLQQVVSSLNLENGSGATKDVQPILFQTFSLMHKQHISISKMVY